MPSSAGMPRGGRAPRQDVEVRAFYADGRDFGEDPVTGSANAGLAQWLIGAGRLPDTYVAGQGGCVQRDGRIHIERRLADIWVGEMSRRS